MRVIWNMLTVYANGYDNDKQKCVRHYKILHQAGVNKFQRPRCFLEFSNEAASRGKKNPESLESEKFITGRVWYCTVLPHALF